ncbi:MAG: sporulation integral membrane protein YtvI [Clostridioides sp.]|nr:sporulation integral membrane protein YtvI [Clostridioides sp.]
MEILEKSFVKKFIRNIIFAIVYTVIFIGIFLSLKYTAPFFLGIIIAFMIKPISTKLYNKFHINKGYSTLILSFLTVALVLTLTTIVGIKLTRQLIEMMNNPQNESYIYGIVEVIADKANMIIDYFGNSADFDMSQLTSKLPSYFLSISKNMLSSLISLASSIPYVLMFNVTLFVSTYFIAKDLDKIEASFYNMFTHHIKAKVFRVKKEIGMSIFGYIRAYAILMTITAFFITVSFYIFNIPYGITFGVIGALLDLIPFLGIISIYLPIVVYYFIIDNFVVAIGMTIMFFIISIIRQIIEPKLISENIGINPLASMAAIFIGIQLKGAIGIIFCFGFVCMYNILKKVNIL